MRRSSLSVCNFATGYKLQLHDINSDCCLKFLFERYCTITFCSEVIHFMEKAVIIRTLEKNTEDVFRLKKEMLQVFNQFIVVDSPEELCLKEQVRVQIWERIEKGLHFDEVFDSALKSCNKDLERILCQFKTSELFDAYERNAKLCSEIVQGTPKEDAFKRLQFIFKTSEFIFYDINVRNPDEIRFFKGNKVCGTGLRDGFFLKIFDIEKRNLCILPNDYLENIPQKPKFQTRERSKSIVTLCGNDKKSTCLVKLHSGSEFEISANDLTALRKYKVIPAGTLISCDSGKTYSEEK